MSMKSIELELAKVATAGDTITVVSSVHGTLATLSTGDVVMVGTVDPAYTPTLAPQMYSIGNFNDKNKNWCRSIRFANDAVYCFRAGCGAVRMAIECFVDLAFAIEPELTWTPPTIVTNPESTSVVKGTAAEFTFEAGSEMTLTYQWQESSNGSTFTDMSSDTPGGTSVTFSGRTTDTLTVNVPNTAPGTAPDAATRNGYSYRCIATDSADGDKTSAAAILTVTNS
jgi:hypothetical protein